MSMSSTSQIVLSDRSALARETALRFGALAREAITTHGTFSVALSGGSTPRDLFVLLAMREFAPQIDWAHVHVFWGDERAVPPDHPDSNYRMANEALLAHVPIPGSHVHRIRAELPPEDAAREYAKELREFFNLDADERGQTQMGKNNPRSSALVGVPSFDLILLGLGANGHTASLFPHTQVLRETQRWVAAEYIAEVKMWRITLTAPVINAAKNILWLVAGADKAETVREVLRGAYRPEDLPAQLIQPTNGNVAWLLDKEAASKLQIGG